MRDRTWFVCLYGEIIPSFSEEIIDRTGAQTMLYLPCTIISSVDLAHYGVSCAKDWVFVDCGTNRNYTNEDSSLRGKKALGKKALTLTTH